MRVRCIENKLGHAAFGVEIGKEYPVLALEAGVGGSWFPPGMVVFVGREHNYTQVPISCVEIIDPNVDSVWKIGCVQSRWLIGYPQMLDEAFHIGLERQDDPRFAQMYGKLLQTAGERNRHG